MGQAELLSWDVRVVVAAEVGRTGAPAAMVVLVGRQVVEGPQDMVVGQQPPPREAGQEV